MGFREAPFNKVPPLFGHWPFGGEGGLNPCPDGLGHLFRENGKKNGKNGKMAKSRLKKSAPECPFECGGGGVIAIWAMPK